MPWCDTCNEYRAPSGVAEDGTCPTCGVRLPAAALREERRLDRRYAAQDESASGEEDVPPIPWHFWLLLAGVVLYLGWRLLQGIGWLVS